MAAHSEVWGSLTKAYLLIIEPTKDGQGKLRETLAFQFNPKELSFQKSASWKSKPMKSAEQTAMPEFQGAEPQTMTIEMFLDQSVTVDGDDKYTQTDIVKTVEKLLTCCTPLTTSKADNKPSPPFVVFGWGGTRSITAYVQQVQVKYTLFKPDGTPIRALCSLQLHEIPTKMPYQNPTSGGLVAHRSHTVVAGDSLASIAYDEYGSPSFWRSLAIANGLDDPMRLGPGATLLILPEADAKELA